MIIRIFVLLILFCSVANAEHLNLPKDANGWTVFTPSLDSTIVYISSTGNDSACVGYAATDEKIGSDPTNPVGPIIPCATYTQAYSKTHSYYPDWILFKRGEEFTDYLSSVRSGRSATEPFVFGSYGTGNMPVIKHGINNGITASLTSTTTPRESHYFAVSGLDFYAHTRDIDLLGSSVVQAGAGGFSIKAGYAGNIIQGIMIEGCKFRYDSVEVFEAFSGGVIEYINFRRNLILSNYAPVPPEGESQSHSQGLLASGIRNSIFEENIFDHNGWVVAAGEGGIGEATIFNHNVYVAGAENTIFKNNIFTRGSNMDTKFTCPDGTCPNITVDGNLYIGGMIGLNMETNYFSYPNRLTNISIVNNVMTNIGMTNNTGQGISWYMELAGWGSGDVSNNLLMNQEGSITETGAVGFKLWYDITGVNIHDNVVYNFEDIGSKALYTDSSSTVYNFYNNTISLPSGTPTLASIKSGTFSMHDNTWYSASGPSASFSYNGSTSSFASFMSSVGDTTSTFEQPSFPDATRSIETYMASIGETSTIDAFIAKCRAQDRYNWDTRFTAPVVNSWLRAGFNMGEYTPPVIPTGRRFRNFRFNFVEK